MGEVLRDCFAFKEFYILLLLSTNLECSFQESQNNQKCHSPLNLEALSPLFRRCFPVLEILLSVPKRSESCFLLLCSDLHELKQNEILKSMLILKTGRCKCEKPNPMLFHLFKYQSISKGLL